jgi:hypothetical protein
MILSEKTASYKNFGQMYKAIELNYAPKIFLMRLEK